MEVMQEIEHPVGEWFCQCGQPVGWSWSQSLGEDNIEWRTAFVNGTDAPTAPDTEFFCEECNEMKEVQQ